VSIYLRAAPESFDKIHSAFDADHITSIIMHHSEAFRLSNYGYGWRPAIREDEPSMWLYQLVNLLTTVTVCSESHKDEVYNIGINRAMPHGTSSSRQLLQFHAPTGMGVDSVAVRFEEPPREVGRGYQKGNKG
jgi:hypothetical protein